VRNVAATILLVAAVVVMLGRIPVGEGLFGHFTEWLMQIPNGAAQRGIIIGAALGAASSRFASSSASSARTWASTRESRSRPWPTDSPSCKSIDRRWIFLLIAIGTLIPIVLPIGFRSPSRRRSRASTT